MCQYTVLYRLCEGITLKYTIQGPSRTCRANTIYRKLNAEGRQAILDRHNDLRRKVAKGDQKGQPPAANMKKMVWSKELEEIAQRWTDQCTFAHDEVRIKKDGTYVGQNGYLIFRRKVTKFDSAMKSMGSVTQRWYDEVERGFNPSGITNFR